jgi:dolichol-phosphate mannosyltransferase
MLEPAANHSARSNPRTGKTRIAVVIPAYRVAAQIEAVIARMPSCVDRIFVVDDASPDDTAETVQRLRNPRLTLLRHAKNEGVGGAMITGIEAALNEGCDIVVKCDGDGQMDPALIPNLTSYLLDNTADHAKGSRFHHFRALRAMPKWRFLGNVGLTFLTKLSSGYWNVLDPVNGFLATRAEVLRHVGIRSLSKRYFFETDLLIRLNILEARVVDVPMAAHYGPETSSLSIARALFLFPLKLLAGLVRRIFWRYVFYDVSPVAVLAILGLLLSFFGGSFGCYEWIKNGRAGIPTPLGTIILAALPCIIGFEMLLQAMVLDIQNTPKAGGAPPRTLSFVTRGEGPVRTEESARTSQHPRV